MEIVLLSKEVFPTYKMSDGKCYLYEDTKTIARSTGTRIEYRFLGILFYAKTFHNHNYWDDCEIIDEKEIKTDF